VIQLKSAREIDIMAHGGQILGATVAMLRREVRPGMSTWELDEIAETFIRSHPGATPSFKGLYGFPGSVCVSINEEIVHGIPSRRRVLKDGDIISIDVGVRYEGYHTDSATTVAVGSVPDESKRLLDVTERALAAGIEAAQPNNHVGDIGAAIQGVVDASGFSIVRDLVGHGIGVAFHEEPQVPVGFEGRSDYTPLGPVVNLASRLSDAAGHGEILVDVRAYEAAANQSRAEERGLDLEGFSEPVRVFAV